ncbi:hypothetical protein [Bacteroides sp. 519]|uniref:hypothetical protein n=1 Tax=Bacteroides sp. 519 TaxID=2302937 RepID=UPI0013D3A75D|nr:hypothetical protein [Bacteroides sp. 519]NDV57206.1 hypothetical protein [Bacteroides sp. 519]
MKLKMPQLFLFMMLLASCEKNPEESPKDGVAIHTIEATANFDLSARKDWIVYVGSEKYNFEIEGNKLFITSPQGGYYHFPYGAKTGNIIIQMAPKDYGKTRTDAKLPPNLEDQSTALKFRNCDRLRFVYTGEAKEDLTDLSVYHFNSLLTFNITNLPVGANIHIEQAYSQDVIPYQEDSNIDAFKAIVFPNNQDMKLIINTNEKTYSAIIPHSATKVRDTGMASGTGNSSIISFSAEINDEELKIYNYKKLNYSKEWPISQ